MTHQDLVLFYEKQAEEAWARFDQEMHKAKLAFLKMLAIAQEKI